MTTIPFIIYQFAVLISWTLFCFVGLKARSSLRLSLLLLFLLFFVGWAIRSYQHYWPHGTVVNETNLYIGPDVSYPKRGRLHVQEHVVIEKKKRRTYYYLSSSQGKGWVQVADVAVEERYMIFNKSVFITWVTFIILVSGVLIADYRRPNPSGASARPRTVNVLNDYTQDLNGRYSVVNFSNDYTTRAMHQRTAYSC